MLATAPRYRIVDDGTNEEAWLEARRPFIGASQMAAILGLSKYSTPLDVWNAMQPGAQPIQENRFMRMGKRMEAPIADWAQEDYGDILGTVLPSPGLVVSLDYPMISATPDRQLEHSGVIDSLVEIKNGGEYTKSDWFDPYTGEDDSPLAYQVQLSQQLWVMGLKFGYLQALIGGNDLLRPRRLDVDEKFVDIMLDTAATWHENYVVKDIPPPATEHDDLKALFPGKPGTKIEATPEIMRLVRFRNRLQPRLSAGDKLDKSTKAQIQAFMGDRTELIDPETGRSVVTWNVGAKPGAFFDKTQFAIDHPSLYQEYVRVKENPSRTMLFPKPKAVK